jgi:hypothetical protein
MRKRRKTSEFDQHRICNKHVFYLAMLHYDWSDELINVVAQILTYYEIKETTGGVGSSHLPRNMRQERRT